MENVSCNLCGANAAEVLFKKWHFHIVQCAHCGLCYINPRHFAMEADDYFQGAYLSTVEEDGKTRPEILHIYREITERLSTYLIPGKLLDVGCAMGHFMMHAREKGWNATGTECSGYAAEYGRREQKLDVHAVCDLGDAHLPEKYFDASVLIEVAEHLPNPRRTFEQVFRVLKPGGLIYVTTPNFTCFRALLRQDNWSAVIPTGHLYYFTAASLEAMLRAVGFTVVTNLTEPGDFDKELNQARETGTLRLTPEAVEELRRATSEEDSGMLSNGRGEGLVLWAVKPDDRNSGPAATLRQQVARPDLEGKLVCGPGSSPEEQKVFYVHDGMRYWVTSVDWLTRHNMRLEDTLQVPRADLDALLMGSSLI